MRQRRVKNEKERLDALRYYIINNPTTWKGIWKHFAKEHIGYSFSSEIYLEIGCGRGHFLAAKAEGDPYSLYLGAEGRSSVLLRSLELIHSINRNNVLFIMDFINDPETIFSDHELSGIYLNFSDPWPKLRHAKRRLTHRRYLNAYKKILIPGSFIEVKTDDDGLFEFTLEESNACDLEIMECAMDLHKTLLPAHMILTQYEHRFQLLGKPIHYCRIKV